MTLKRERKIVLKCANGWIFISWECYQILGQIRELPCMLFSFFTYVLYSVQYKLFPVLASELQSIRILWWDHNMECYWHLCFQNSSREVKKQYHSCLLLYWLIWYLCNLQASAIGEYYIQHVKAFRILQCRFLQYYNWHCSIACHLSGQKKICLRKNI